jgi:hypothetical protein
VEVASRRDDGLLTSSWRHFFRHKCACVMELLDSMPALPAEHPVTPDIAPVTTPAKAAAAANEFDLLFMVVLRIDLFVSNLRPVLSLTRYEFTEKGIGRPGQRMGTAWEPSPRCRNLGHPIKRRKFKSHAKHGNRQPYSAGEERKICAYSQAARCDALQPGASGASHDHIGPNLV